MICKNCKQPIEKCEGDGVCPFKGYLHTDTHIHWCIPEHDRTPENEDLFAEPLNTKE
jgi:hypothetical protein